MCGCIVLYRAKGTAQQQRQPQPGTAVLSREKLKGNPTAFRAVDHSPTRYVHSTVANLLRSSNSNSLHAVHYSVCVYTAVLYYSCVVRFLFYSRVSPTPLNRLHSYARRLGTAESGSAARSSRPLVGRLSSACASCTTTMSSSRAVAPAVRNETSPRPRAPLSTTPSSVQPVRSHCTLFLCNVPQQWTRADLLSSLLLLSSPLNAHILPSVQPHPSTHSLPSASSSLAFALFPSPSHALSAFTTLTAAVITPVALHWALEGEECGGIRVRKAAGGGMTARALREEVIKVCTLVVRLRGEDVVVDGEDVVVNVSDPADAVALVNALTYAISIEAVKGVSAAGWRVEWSARVASKERSSAFLAHVRSPPTAPSSAVGSPFHFGAVTGAAALSFNASATVAPPPPAPRVTPSSPLTAAAAPPRVVPSSPVPPPPPRPVQPSPALAPAPAPAPAPAVPAAAPAVHAVNGESKAMEIVREERKVEHGRPLPVERPPPPASSPPIRPSQPKTSPLARVGEGTPTSPSVARRRQSEEDSRSKGGGASSSSGTTPRLPSRTASGWSGEDRWRAVAQEADDTDDASHRPTTRKEDDAWLKRTPRDRDRDDAHHRALPPSSQPPRALSPLRGAGHGGAPRPSPSPPAPPSSDVTVARSAVAAPLASSRFHDERGRERDAGRYPHREDEMSDDANRAGHRGSDRDRERRGSAHDSPGGYDARDDDRGSSREHRERSRTDDRDRDERGHRHPHHDRHGHSHSDGRHTQREDESRRGREAHRGSRVSDSIDARDMRDRPARDRLDEPMGSSRGGSVAVGLPRPPPPHMSPVHPSAPAFSY